MARFYLLFTLLLIIGGVTLGCSDDGGNIRDAVTTERVRVGAENLIENHLHRIREKKIGLVMNPTARINQIHMLDTLLALGLNVKALFSPEHGFRGEAGAGEVIEDGVDQATGLPVYSLYGKTRKPTSGMLSDIDLLLFDMQDVGARFYTYASTLALVLEAAAENSVEVWVLDRPNPAGGDYVDGWLMEDEYSSFVGMFPIPVSHGLTLGELGSMMIGEQWIKFPQKELYKVIPISGYTRSMKWPDTGLEWFPPSPNLPAFEHAYVYLGTCFFEGTSLSEGRGTSDPFLLLGGPTTEISEEKLIKLNESLTGVYVRRETFTPRSIPGKALRPKHENAEVNGIRIVLEDIDSYRPVFHGLTILSFLMKYSPGASANDYMYRLSGSSKIDSFLTEPVFDDRTLEHIDQFKKARATYFLYE